MMLWSGALQCNIRGIQTTKNRVSLHVTEVSILMISCVIPSSPLLSSSLSWRHMWAAPLFVLPTVPMGALSEVLTHVWGRLCRTFLIITWHSWLRGMINTLGNIWWASRRDPGRLDSLTWLKCIENSTAAWSHLTLIMIEFDLIISEDIHQLSSECEMEDTWEQQTGPAQIFIYSSPVYQHPVITRNLRIYTNTDHQSDRV